MDLGCTKTHSSSRSISKTTVFADYTNENTCSWVDLYILKMVAKKKITLYFLRIWTLGKNHQHKWDDKILCGNRGAYSKHSLTVYTVTCIFDGFLWQILSWICFKNQNQMKFWKQRPTRLVQSQKNHFKFLQWESAHSSIWSYVHRSSPPSYWTVRPLYSHVWPCNTKFECNYSCSLLLLPPALIISLSLALCLSPLCLAPLVLDSQILLLHLSVSRALRLFFFLPAVMGGFRLPLHHGSPDCTQRLKDRWDSKRNWMLRISREWGEIWLRDCCHEISHS